jgi:hypothetical protein
MKTVEHPLDGHPSKAIYTVTCLVLKRDDKGNCYFTQRRCWGWFLRLKTAKQAVRENWSDYFECDFTHAVIEETAEGTIAMATRVWWYRAYRDTSGLVNRIVRVKKPLDGGGCYGMG